MDYPRDNMFTYAFSTYKKTAGIAFAAILLIAIPLSVAFLSQNQDIRQRAQVAEAPSCSTNADCQEGFSCVLIQEEDSTIRNACRPNGSEQNQPIPPQQSCTTDNDCPTGNLCVGEGDEAFRYVCKPLEGRSCSTNADCLEGYSCQTVGIAESMPPQEIKQCKLDVSRGGACSCDGIDFAGYNNGYTGVVSYAKGNVQSQKFTLFEMDDSSQGRVVEVSEDKPVQLTTRSSYRSDWGMGDYNLEPGKTYKILANISCGSEPPQIQDDPPIGSYPSSVPDNFTNVSKSCNSLTFTTAGSQNQSCNADSDCPSGNSCQVVGIAESFPPVEIKQCRPNTTLPQSCKTDSDCASTHSCQVVGVRESFPPVEIKQCRLKTTRSVLIFDFNDDGKIDAKDLNVLYAGFANRMGD